MQSTQGINSKSNRPERRKLVVGGWQCEACLHLRLAVRTGNKKEMRDGSGKLPSLSKFRSFRP
ncbi:MAG: hypothetical protein PWQ41_480 [Bacillota bacterium]|nr:hypothetical protein [Bacillota bacterium]MDK2924706.1 hypothetical protein [Bacillota bacterium]